ncbi:MAG TPA: MATE family efflux transporter [Chloroflexia bacterium]|nr:MATE family efflux transporter [Chloroflexia bacterium]
MRQDRADARPGASSTNGRTEEEFDLQEAEAAAQEVASATDNIAAGGAAVVPAAQAEQVARGDAVVPADAHEPDLTHQERREVGRSVFRLAWPAIAENALQTLLGVVDTAVVARLGTAALSGVGAAHQLVWVLTTALIAISMGTTVLIARFVGARETHNANSVLRQSLLMSVVFSALLAPVALLSHPMMTALGLTPAAAEEGTTYLSITLAAGVFIVVMFVASAALRGAGDTRTPMMVTGFINVINALLAVELVFGGAQASAVLSDWLGVPVPGLDWIPAMGVAGSAWATVIARAIGTVILLGVFFMPNSVLKIAKIGISWRPDFGMIRRMLKIGIPSAFEQMFMSLGILVYSFLVIGMGEIVFATSRLALNAVFLSQMPGFGFAMAATTLVGQSLGARSPKRALLGAQLATRSAVVWMGIMGVVFFFFGEPLMRVFTDDRRLIDLGVEALKVIAFNQPFLALAFVLAGALRGAGDVRFPMWVTTVAVWAVRLPTGAFMGLDVLCIPGTSMCIPGLGWGLPGIYGALIVESLLRAGLLYKRFREGKWQSMKV